MLIIQHPRDQYLSIGSLCHQIQNVFHHSWIKLHPRDHAWIKYKINTYITTVDVFIPFIGLKMDETHNLRFSQKPMRGIFCENNCTH